MPKRMRRIILTECESYDLRAAQLAIVAKVWDIPKVAELVSLSDPWAVLLDSLGLPRHMKGELKTLVYSIVFGKSERNLDLDALILEGTLPPYEGFGADDIPNHLKDKGLEWLNSSPYLASLLEARTRRRRAVRKAGGIRDAFGVFHPLEKSTGSRQDNLLTLLSYEAQSYERSIMLPLYQLAFNPKQRDFTVMLDLHDGVYIKYHRYSKRWEPKIMEAVNCKARELKILTILDRD